MNEILNVYKINAPLWGFEKPETCYEFGGWVRNSNHPGIGELRINELSFKKLIDLMFFALERKN